MRIKLKINIVRDTRGTVGDGGGQGKIPSPPTESHGVVTGTERGGGQVYHGNRYNVVGPSDTFLEDSVYTPGEMR